MQQSLIQKLSEAAKDIHDAFPEKLARLVVLIIPEAEIVYAAPAVADHLAVNTPAVRQTAETFAQQIQEISPEAVGSAVKNYELAGIKMNVVSLLDLTKDDMYDARTQEMEALFFLDHELGHHILANGSSTITAVSQNKAESACDTFAALRHIQRFGKNTEFTENHCAAAAANIVLFSDISHYTSESVGRALKVADDMGDAFFRLSLRETAALAAKVADETCLAEATLEEVNLAYMDVANAAAAEEDAPFHPGIFAVMEQHRDNAAIFNAGKWLLREPSIKDTIKYAATLKPKDIAWKKVIAFVEAQEQKAKAARPKATPRRRAAATARPGL